MREFLTFIREQGVVGLAIGFMLGGAASNVVSSFVDGIVNPLLGLFFKNIEDLNNAVISIGEASISWGMFAVALIDFVILAALVFFIFKRLGIVKLDTKKTS